jgi:hypothetical protein
MTRASPKLQSYRVGSPRDHPTVGSSARTGTFGTVASLPVHLDQRVHGTVDEAAAHVTLAEVAGADSYGVADEVARYYLTECADGEVVLGITPELGRPEHQESRWVPAGRAEAFLNERLQAVLDWVRARLEG